MSRPASARARDSTRMACPGSACGGACADGAENSFVNGDSADSVADFVAVGRAADGLAAAAAAGEINCGPDDDAAVITAADCCCCCAEVAVEAWARRLKQNCGAMAEQVIPFLGQDVAATAAIDGDGDTTWEAIVSQAWKERRGEKVGGG